MQSLTFSEIALRLGAAVLCALLIGLEREVKHKNAGIRTYILVCLGCTGFTILIQEIGAYFQAIRVDIQLDPSRIVQGVVTGLGFLGGGAILQRNEGVTGVATGAGIWVSGAIGIACGFGFYTLAILLTLATTLVLGVLGVVRAKFRDDIDEDKGDVSGNGCE
ncbi:MAG: MgtC/SapB family protein [Alphaproteobacteria bacterium]|nr:MgtC/SapB family protein [Alphaproteobacteria bacterium]